MSRLYKLSCIKDGDDYVIGYYSKLQRAIEARGNVVSLVEGVAINLANDISKPMIVLVRSDQRKDFHLIITRVPVDKPVELGFRL